MFDVADVCPSCGKPQLPPLKVGSIARARACQSCGYVQELNPVMGKPIEFSNADPASK